ncbi:STE/STE20 protein kinase [Thecamonas trahens ATCC 50062]|uniref:non-specific serine/threonine protein kinase n=1 Tax=Thecamonas trahens ATCC 50062 TaxID=461836 RepID=A0A0L0DV39_THETB|nr:STE/STE20 protein kinase [Thecamonas trahens ATCC 50062]KNC56070.1 STE/STE20 protein kinase [Thecamonas trahens ATCC 50062]|eukprot:XP_013761114.1 STE/STE20 protein kinase [Thecamonas trahens ATCC 50062]
MPRKTKSRLKITNLLGAGAFGDVYAAQLGNDEVAAKAVSAGSENGARPETEAKMLARAGTHPNVVSYLGTMRDGGTRRRWLVLELCAHGSVAALLAARGSGLPEAAVAHVTASVVAALAHLHSPQIGIAHRDVKAANLLVDAKGNIKLADFGEAVELDASLPPGAELAAGSPHWMAPELMAAEGADVDLAKADVWALGITVIELVQGEPPLAREHPMRVLRKIASRTPPRLARSAFPKRMRTFVAKALAHDPAARPAVAKLSSHSFVRSKSRRHLGRELLLDALASAAHNASTATGHDSWLLHASDSDHSTALAASLVHSGISFLTGTPSPTPAYRPRPARGPLHSVSSSSSAASASSSETESALSMSTISPASSSW